MRLYTLLRMEDFNMSDAEDPKYKEQYEKMHQKDMFKGNNYEDRYMNMIFGMVKATRSKTILDFGSGKGHQYHERKVNHKMGIKLENVTCYDPGVPQFSQLPTKRFDGIVSFDVMEHIPREELDGVLAYIFNTAKKFVFLVIHCGLAYKKLPNGDNAHCTVMSPKEWDALIRKHNVDDIPVVCHYKIPKEPHLNILNL